MNGKDLKERTEKEHKAYRDGFKSAYVLIDEYWRRGDNINDIINRLKLLHGAMVKSQKKEAKL